MNLNLLNRQLQEMETYFSSLHARNNQISKVTVGWHLAHILKVINGGCYSMAASNPNDYKATFSLTKVVVFLIGAFPRGKVKAPKIVMPGEEINKEDLIVQLATARNYLNQFNGYDKNNFFQHPQFDHLNKKDAKRLLEIHTGHHLKIIRDILN